MCLTICATFAFQLVIFISEESLFVDAIKLSVVQTAVFHLYIIWYCDETRGVTRLDGARGKKQYAGVPMLEPEFFGSKCISYWSKYTVLKYIKVLVTLLGLFGAPHSDSAPGELFLPCPLAASMNETTITLIVLPKVGQVSESSECKAKPCRID